MPGSILFSIVESPTHPNFFTVYKELGFEEIRLDSMRNAIKALKKQVPDVVVAEFFYGYGNNYAGINVSNLDVFLRSLQKYSPATRIIIFVDKNEREYVAKLEALFPLHAVLTHPVGETQLRQALQS
jgi:AmiR/NasT family two-component response regulator